MMAPSFVHVFPLCLECFYDYGLGLYFHVLRACSVATPERSPLGQILADWSKYSYDPMTKKELVLYCNTAWSMYTLIDYEG